MLPVPYAFIDQHIYIASSVESMHQIDTLFPKCIQRITLWPMTSNTLYGVLCRSGLLKYYSVSITITITITITSCTKIAYYYYYYYYVIYLNSLLLLLVLKTLSKPITITIPSQTIAITITFPLLLHFLLLLNQRNTTQADYKVIPKDLYYLHCITPYHRHIITDNIILKLSWKF